MLKNSNKQLVNDVSIQTELGNAFEYACLQSIYNELADSQAVVIEQNIALEIARQKYENATPDMQNKMDLGSDVSIRLILRLEPQLTTPLTNVPLYL